MSGAAIVSTALKKKINLALGDLTLHLGRSLKVRKQSSPRAYLSPSGWEEESCAIISVS